MKTVHAVLSMTTQEVVKTATELLCKHYKQVMVHNEDFIYAVGEGPITLVAHMDTVRDMQVDPDAKFQRHDQHAGKPFELVHYGNTLRNLKGVLGADDRAGVFGCIELMRRCIKEKLPMPSIILTNGEESGGKGVKVFEATEAFKKHDAGKTRLFVEMDRQGCNDWVTYGSPLPKEVIAYVESFGFIKSGGSFSDIAVLQEAYGIPSVNVSIGYYRQHSSDERMHVDEMYMTINRVLNMMRDPISQLYVVAPKPKYTYESKIYGGHQSGNYGVNSTDGKKTDTLLQKNSGTSTVKTRATGEWIESVGDDHIDKVLTRMTQGGFCIECGHFWCDCECGDLFTSLQAWLPESDLRFLRRNYLEKDDPMYIQISEHLTLLSVDDPKDPFHVGKVDEVITAEVITDIEKGGNK